MPVVTVQKPFFEYEIPDRSDRIKVRKRRKSIRFRTEWGDCVFCKKENLCVVFERGLICKGCIEGALKDESEKHAGSVPEERED